MTSTAELLRLAYPKVLARTLAFTRHLPEAEDAVQQAMVRALSTWPQRGIPEVPEAWLLTVATNFYRDKLRKRKWESPDQDALEILAQMSPWARMALGEREVESGWKDDLLRLVFACCHPSLKAGQSAALCLSTVVGLSTKEVAMAFSVQPRTMEQRLVRAREQLRQQGNPDGAPPQHSLDRLQAGLRVVHLLFNEGYWSTRDDSPIRSELCRLAVGLSHSLALTFPNEPEALALLALLMLHDARREARLDSTGTPIPLPDQDRDLWDHQSIEDAENWLERALRLNRVGPFQVEAAIAALHCQARLSSDTDWTQIAHLYERLEELRPTPAVRVNRAFALAQAQGPRAGLELLDHPEPPKGSESPYVHVVRGALLVDAGMSEQARASYLEAQKVARNEAERQAIARRIVALWQ